MRTRASQVRLSEAQQLEEQLARKAEQAKQKALVRDLNETFSTSAGMRSLRYILEICGYQKSNVVVDPNTGNVLKDSVLYNEARRLVYLGIRKHLRKEILVPVEVTGLNDEDGNIFS